MGPWSRPEDEARASGERSGPNVASRAQSTGTPFFGQGVHHGVHQRAELPHGRRAADDQARGAGAPAGRGGADRRRVRGHPRPDRDDLRPALRTRPGQHDLDRRQERGLEDHEREVAVGLAAHTSRGQGVPGLGLGALCYVVGLLLLVAPGTARAQSAPPGERSVLLILDGSKSMNDAAGNGQTRLAAAKAALREVIKALPDDAKVGLRVYGSRVSEASRAQGCRDTQLVSPVGPLDRDALQGRVDALQGKGRTPIGRSLLAAPGDLGADGVRLVVLVSDGGDNCAPPNPCRAAAKVARGGVDLSISVVGLQVAPRVRRQLKCIARAGGGAYVDAGDPDALRAELLAALARAFRSYDPTGTPVHGGASAARAPLIGEGQYLDHLRPGDERFYAARLAPGQKLFASVTAIPARTLNGSAAFRAHLIAPDGQEGTPDVDVLRDDRLGQFGTISTFGLRTDQAAAPGITSDDRAGVWKVAVQLEPGDLGEKDIPVELAIQTLAPNEPPGLARRPGAPGRAVPSATPTPSATPSPAGRASGRDDDGGGSGAALAAGGGGGLPGGPPRGL